MKRRIVYVAGCLLAASMLFAGCGENENQEVSEQTGNQIETGEEVQNDAAEENEAGAEGTANLDSVGEVSRELVYAFRETIAEDQEVSSVIVKMSEKTSALAGNELSMGEMMVEPGYLNGFNEEITQFEEGGMFAPMIGTIPFVGYVFKTNDSDALVQELNASYMMNWNICTEADDMVIDVCGEYVLFVMSPSTFEQ